MRSIGGFLDLEMARGTGHPYHETAALSTGRSCFFFLLKYLQPTRVRLPYYICDVLLPPLQAAGVPYTFYELDHLLEIRYPPTRLDRNELLLYVNYFGLKSHYIRKLQTVCGTRLVLDNTQAFFERGYPGFWSFNSARKFFGVPDGAYLYCPGEVAIPSLPPATPRYDHLMSRMVGRSTEAYRQFQLYEASLDYGMKSMSDLSSVLLRHVDYDEVADRRRKNFQCLHAALGQLNHLDCALVEDDVPLYYPFLSEAPLRERLIEREIFVPYLWSEVQTRTSQGFAWERQLARRLSPLPVDQRYHCSDMAKIAEEVTRFLRK